MSVRRRRAGRVAPPGNALRDDMRDKHLISLAYRNMRMPRRRMRISGLAVQRRWREQRRWRPQYWRSSAGAIHNVPLAAAQQKAVRYAS